MIRKKPALGRKPALLPPYERLDGLGFPNTGRSRRRALFLRLEISLSQGGEWKALISRYMTVIPFIGDAPCIGMQNISGWPSKKAVQTAMMAKVGVAARPSHPAGAAWPPPARVSASWRTSGDICASVMAVPVVMTPPDARLLVAALRRSVEPLVHAPQAVQPARVG
jgi:hypothetical protein